MQLGRSASKFRRKVQLPSSRLQSNWNKKPAQRILLFMLLLAPLVPICGHWAKQRTYRGGFCDIWGSLYSLLNMEVVGSVEIVMIIRLKVYHHIPDNCEVLVSDRRMLTKSVATSVWSSAPPLDRIPCLFTTSRLLRYREQALECSCFIRDRLLLFLCFPTSLCHVFVSQVC
jgi:hypothetical protein